MLKVQVDENDSVSVSRQKKDIIINDKIFDGELIKVDERSFKVYKGNTIYKVEVVEKEGKQITLKVNQKLLQVSVTDHIDQILDKLGMNIASANVLKEVKAPMPGSILNIVVEEGQSVNSGDQLLVLEAMKMENVIKSPGEGVVSKIMVKEKENVEKNQVLISFE